MGVGGYTAKEEAVLNREQTLGWTSAVAGRKDQSLHPALKDAMRV